MVSTAHVPAITLNNGVALPAFGLGVFQSPPAETVGAVEAAIAAGYQMIDTAASYLNERQVGEGIRNSAVQRKNLFIQTKLWISDYGFDSALHAFEVSARKLGVDYVDLYMLHQPMPNEWERTVAAYTALERLLADGRVRAIGVSNFSAKHLDDLMARSSIVPAVNQVEVHPYFIQRELRAVHERLGIATQAWSPLGGINVYRPADPNAVKNALTHPIVNEIASRHAKSPAQVVLRWHIEHGFSAIPKSVRPARIVENFGVFDFVLTPEEVASIDSLDEGVRGGPDPEKIDTQVFKLTIPDA